MNVYKAFAAFSIRNVLHKGFKLVEIHCEVGAVTYWGRAKYCVRSGLKSFPSKEKAKAIHAAFNQPIDIRWRNKLVIRATNWTDFKVCPG